MPDPVDMGIIIVNWNTRDLLRECLKSLAAGDPSVTRRVIVVDNASSDGSADMVRAEFPAVEVIANPVNGGFAQANNLGLKALGFVPHHLTLSPPRSEGETGGGVRLTAEGRGQRDETNKPRYALLLNPDTVVPPDGLRKLIDRVEAAPKIGVIGPRLVMLDGKLDLACRRSFPTPEVSLWRMTGLSKLFPKSRLFGRYNMTYLDEYLETEVDCVVGAFMMVRRAAIDQVGLLDESFWMYGEDIDWAFRIKQAGWKVLYYPQVTVLHVKRAASRQNPRTQLEFQRASLIFYRKHYAATTPRLLHLAILIGLLVKGGHPLWDELRKPS
ncbi:MAG: glycosyltransferase family 2 protein [Anaerolineae bacterium]|nr:glycosyltransferase family 2 protein [Anaerolineae bacterium]